MTLSLSVVFIDHCKLVILLEPRLTLHPPFAIKYHIFVEQLSHCSPCQLTILISLVIITDPYDPPPTTIILGNKGIESQITHEPLGSLVLDMTILVGEAMPCLLC
jgi:hypothetical protein